jgi:hypothetical protein
LPLPTSPCTSRSIGEGLPSPLDLAEHALLRTGQPKGQSLCASFAGPASPGAARRDALLASAGAQAQCGPAAPPVPSPLRRMGRPPARAMSSPGLRAMHGQQARQRGQCSDVAHVARQQLQRIVLRQASSANPISLRNDAGPTPRSPG